MKNLNVIVIYIFLISIIAYLVYDNGRKDKIVYVDNIELFSGFHMKTELEKKYKQVEGSRKSILDSIYTEIKIKAGMENTSGDDALNLLKKEFLMKKELFDKENAETMESYNAQIWNQLNEYTKQYGKEKRYEFILGANGQGVLMYAEDTKNVTKELLQFANTKFNGK